MVAQARGPRYLLRSVGATLRGLPWILRERRLVPAHVEAALAALDAFEARGKRDADS
jgi:hypothetical protein